MVVNSPCWDRLSEAFFKGKHTGQSLRVQFFQWEIICLDDAQCATAIKQSKTVALNFKKSRRMKKDQCYKLPTSEFKSRVNRPVTSNFQAAMQY